MCYCFLPCRLCRYFPLSVQKSQGHRRRGEKQQPAPPLDWKKHVRSTWCIQELWHTIPNQYCRNKDPRPRRPLVGSRHVMPRQSSRFSGLFFSARRESSLKTDQHLSELWAQLTDWQTAKNILNHWKQWLRSSVFRVCKCTSETKQRAFFSCLFRAIF